MKKAFYILVLSVFCLGCKMDKKPLFIGVDKVSVVKSELDTLVIRADAQFSNGNDLGGTLLTHGIKVFIDSAYVATVSSKAFRVPPRDNFTVPLLVKIPTSKLIDKGNGNLLGTIIRQVISNRVIVDFRGFLTYKLSGFSFDYPIDHREEISFK